MLRIFKIGNKCAFNRISWPGTERQQRGTIEQGGWVPCQCPEQISVCWTVGESSRVTVKWLEWEAVDHLLISLRLPFAVAGLARSQWRKGYKRHCLS